MVESLQKLIGRSPALNQGRLSPGIFNESERHIRVERPLPSSPSHRTIDIACYFVGLVIYAADDNDIQAGNLFTSTFVLSKRVDFRRSKFQAVICNHISGAYDLFYNNPIYVVLDAVSLTIIWYLSIGLSALEVGIMKLQWILRIKLTLKPFLFPDWKFDRTHGKLV